MRLAPLALTAMTIINGCNSCEGTDRRAPEIVLQVETRREAISQLLSKACKVDGFHPVDSAQDFIEQPFGETACTKDSRVIARAQCSVDPWSELQYNLAYNFAYKSCTKDINPPTKIPPDIYPGIVFQERDIKQHVFTQPNNPTYRCMRIVHPVGFVQVTEIIPLHCTAVLIDQAER